MSTQPSPIIPRGRPHSVRKSPVSPQYSYFFNLRAGLRALEAGRANGGMRDAATGTNVGRSNNRGRGTSLSC